MKISSARSGAVSEHTQDSPIEPSAGKPRAPAASLGKLSDLSSMARPKRGAGATGATMGADNGTTPFHAGTQNDCGLHTIASLTGWSEPTVVQKLGLSEQDVKDISAHGMQPDTVTAAFKHINNGNVEHRQGTADDLVKGLAQFPEGHQFALGMQRDSGIGHLVSAKRVGDRLDITDRQINQTTSVRNEQELQQYLQQQGASKIHTWYDK
ncbi:hypothetical protein BCO18175_00450 [Burkholderia contaminans]|nr:hypothetical protein BCO18175_00450 [Burkholderia contaminans]VWC83051.1 hypothetical protein BCO19218_01371 [Burkholderia contaminans]VWC91171.1 hypothetical protein BCO18430_03260 [Burkholderia contaminans]